MAAGLAKPVHIEFFFDVVSPYSWFGATLLSRYSMRQKGTARPIEVNWRPFFLGGVMQATGNQPPAMLPARGKYLMTDIARTAEWLGLSCQTPSNFPANSIHAQRILTYFKSAQPELVEPLAFEFWNAYWSRDEDISNPQVLAACCQAVVPDVDAEALLASSRTGEVKEALKQETATAIELGAYGAPFMVVSGGSRPDGEERIFFGSDRFHLILPPAGVPFDGALRPGTSAKL